MTVAPQQSRELIALEGGSSRATPAAASRGLPILATCTTRVPRFTAGISPAAFAEAYLDWATHFAYERGKRLPLVDKAMHKAMRFSNYLQKYAMSGGKTDARGP